MFLFEDCSYLRIHAIQKGVHLLFKKGQTMGRYFINGGPPKWQSRKSYIKSHVPVVAFAILGRPLNSLMKEKNNTNDTSRIVSWIMVYISIYKNIRIISLHGYNSGLWTPTITPERWMNQYIFFCLGRQEVRILKMECRRTTVWAPLCQCTEKKFLREISTNLCYAERNFN